VRPFNAAEHPIDCTVNVMLRPEALQGLSPEKLADTLEAMDSSARLLLDQAREAKARADKLETALSLLVGVVANDPGLEENYALQRIAGQLRLCADLPELAAELVGCEADRIEPVMLRAAANIIAAAGKPDAVSQAVTHELMDRDGATLH